MPLIYLVRHGRVTDAPRDPRDPELDALGLAQAEDAARELAQRIGGPLPILVSPLRRCRETAAPLARLWAAAPVVEPRVVEVPSPDNPGLSRNDWLDHALASTWAQAEAFGESYQAGYAQFLRGWRRGVLEAVLACAGDTVIFSHYVPINVLAGHASGWERIAGFRPANGSITVFEVEGETIRLREQGREVASRVV
jgi:broad specificity phosphatase PhoE